MADFRDETVGRDLNPDDMSHESFQEAVDDAITYAPDGQPWMDADDYDAIMNHYEATVETLTPHPLEEMSDEDAMAGMPEGSD